MLQNQLSFPCMQAANKKMGRAKRMEKVFSFSLLTNFNLREAWHMKMAVSTTKFPEIFHLSVF